MHQQESLPHRGTLVQEKELWRLPLPKTSIRQAVGNRIFRTYDLVMLYVLARTSGKQATVLARCACVLKIQTGVNIAR